MPLHGESKIPLGKSMIIIRVVKKLMSSSAILIPLQVGWSF